MKTVDVKLVEFDKEFRKKTTKNGKLVVMVNVLHPDFTSIKLGDIFIHNLRSGKISNIAHQVVGFGEEFEVQETSLDTPKTYAYIYIEEVSAFDYVQRS